MRQLDLVRLAARKYKLDYREMERHLRAFLVTGIEMLQNGEIVSVYPIGKIHPVELERDRRRKRRGVKLCASEYMEDMMKRSNVELGDIKLGDILRIES